MGSGRHLAAFLGQFSSFCVKMTVKIRGIGYGLNTGGGGSQCPPPGNVEHQTLHFLHSGEFVCTNVLFLHQCIILTFIYVKENTNFRHQVIIQKIME